MMDWYRENRWLGNFLIVFGVVTLLALYFLFHAKGGFNDAAAQFDEAANERNRLERLNPFPNEDNFHKMQGQLENYGAAVTKLKEQLRTAVLPASVTLAPNEFQSLLTQAINSATDKARTSRVKLPDNFKLGFDEYTARLPDTPAAPFLGQELSQVELLTNILIDARVDALTALKREPLPEEKSATPTPSPGRKAPERKGPEMIQRAVVEVTFTSSPTALRKVLNEVASSKQQFFVVRILHVHNEQQKGPAREQQAGAASTAGAPANPSPAPTPTGAIKFIVGNEHLETTARVELIRFNL